MGEIIGQLLPYAVVIAISPVPIIAVILMLLAPRAGRTSAGFLIGWLLGIIVGTTIVVILSGLIGPSDDDPSTVLGWIKLVLGVLLVAAALNQFRHRPRAGEEPKLPSWMSAIDTVTPVRAVAIGAALSGINPKNLAMSMAAGSTIGTAGLPVGSVVVCVAVFTFLAASTVAVPVVAYAVAADRLRGPLESLRTWLVADSAVIMGTLLLTIGAVLVGQGIAGVT